MRDRKSSAVFVVLLDILLYSPCDGHGHMTYPNSSRHGGSVSLGGDCEKSSGACYWFTNNQPILVEPTLNEAWIRSVNINESGTSLDWSAKNPWRAPGRAPVLGSGCGVAGGGDVLYANGGTPPKGVAQGMDGSALPKKAATIWPRGSTQQVGMAVSANHAGGYSWRLCRDDGSVSEACFQQNTLRFAGSKQHILYTSGEWSEIPLVKVSTGTYPEGSEWARFPVPSCVQCQPATTCGEPIAPMPGNDYGSSWNQQVNCNAACHGSGASKKDGSCPGQSQFPEPIAGMSGFGKSIWEWSVIDEVLVPDDLEPGDYLLSMRWDCEQSDQVFQNCADIQITVDDSNGSARLVMDPQKRVSVYKASGNVKCDGLYEDCANKKDAGSKEASYGTVQDACLKLGPEGCGEDPKCAVREKQGVRYCWISEEDNTKTKTNTKTGASEGSQDTACKMLGVEACANTDTCEVLDKAGKKYCWVKEMAEDQGTTTGASDNASSSGAVRCLLRRTSCAILLAQLGISLQWW